MSCPSACARCGGPRAGARIERQGPTTWSELNDLWIHAGILPDPCSPPPGVDLLYLVLAICPGCGVRCGDFLLGDSRDPSAVDAYRDKVARYRSSTVLTAEMLDDDWATAAAGSCPRCRQCGGRVVQRSADVTDVAGDAGLIALFADVTWLACEDCGEQFDMA